MLCFKSALSKWAQLRVNDKMWEWNEKTHQQQWANERKKCINDYTDFNEYDYQK